MAYWIFSLALIINLFHAVPVADFNLFISDQFIDVEIEFEQNDLDKILDKNSKVSNENQIFNYLKNNFSIVIDDVIPVIDYCHINTKSDHYHIQAEIKLAEDKPKIIQVKNTSLLNYIDRQTNNLFIHYKHMYRGFKMDKQRIKILVNLLEEN